MEEHITIQHLEDITENCLSARLRLLTRRVNSIYDGALRDFSIKASQVGILAMVARRGETNCKTLCCQMKMDSSTFSRSLARLRKNGWLRSEASGDGKILKITITSEGRTLLGRVYPVWQKAQDEAFGFLGKELAEGLHSGALQEDGSDEPLDWG